MGEVLLDNPIIRLLLAHRDRALLDLAGAREADEYNSAGDINEERAAAQLDLIDDLIGEVRNILAL